MREHSWEWCWHCKHCAKTMTEDERDPDKMPGFCAYPDDKESDLQDKVRRLENSLEYAGRMSKYLRYRDEGFPPPAQQLAGAARWTPLFSEKEWVAKMMRAVGVKEPPEA